MIRTDEMWIVTIDGCVRCKVSTIVGHVMQTDGNVDNLSHVMWHDESVVYHESHDRVRR